MDQTSFLAIWLCKIIIIIIVNIIIIVIIIIIISITIMNVTTRYVHGFGDPAAEFWLGLDKLKQLTR